MVVSNKEKLNRSEAIRQRRELEANKQTVQKNPQVQNIAVVHNTPVFVRQGVVGTPVIQRTRTSVKRKIAVSRLDGSEVIIPALPILRPGWRLVSGFLSFSFTVVIVLILTTNIFDVSALSIQGLQRVSAADIASLIHLEGTPAFLLDPDDILADIETSFPEFYDVKVNITFPAIVNIQLNERNPVLAWKYNTLTLWVDSEGNVFTPRGEADDLIIIKSSEAPPRIQVQMSEREIQIAEELGRTQSEDNLLMKDGPVDPELVQQILELHDRMPEIKVLTYNSKSGYGWNNEEKNWNVYFGHELDDLDQKLLLYEAIEAYVLNKGIKINTISVAFTRAPFYRLE